MGAGGEGRKRSYRRHSVVDGDRKSCQKGKGEAQWEIIYFSDKKENKGKRRTVFHGFLFRCSVARLSARNEKGRKRGSVGLIE